MTKQIVTGTLALVLMTLAACDNGTDGSGGSGGSSGAGKSSQPFVSGSRLKVRKIVGTDGAEQQLGFRDTELGFDCTFAKAEDGSQRCLPSAAQHDGRFFTDAQCTIPFVESSCGAPSFIRVTPEVCGGNGAIWDGVTAFSGPGFQLAGNGECQSGSTLNGFAGGAKMMLSAFAEGKEETE